jgi:hypothetical protein
MTIQDVALYGTSIPQFAVSAAAITCKDIKFKGIYAESINGRVGTFNSRENIVFENCDFQGASITDLTSSSFFDEVFARNVRTGTTYYTSNGSSVQSGDGATVAFNIAHGLEATPTWWNVQAASTAAGAVHAVTATSTNLVVTFAAAPANAADNLTFKWEASMTLPPARC